MAIKTTLVTGGAGFIGSHLVDRLVATGRRVVVLDDLSTGLPENLAAHDGRVDLQVGSVADPEACRRAVADVDEVFHLASRVSVVESIEDPDLYRDVVLGGTRNILQAAAEKPGSRVVLASSCSVYGDAPPPIPESAPTDPQSPYAAFKLEAEEACRASGVSTICPRFFNVYGPRQRHDSPYSGVIAIFRERARAGTAPTIFGDGLQTRDFVHVSDVVDCLLGCMENRAVEDGRPLNVGTGRATTVLELTRLLGCLEPRLEPARDGEIRHSMADVGLAMETLGFRAAIEIAEGLATLDAG